MNADISRIAEDLLALPNDSRVYLGELLIESVDDFVDDEIRTAWSSEIAKRIEQFEAGEVEGIPSDEVFRQARQRLREARDLSS